MLIFIFYVVAPFNFFKYYWVPTLIGSVDTSQLYLYLVDILLATKINLAGEYIPSYSLYTKHNFFKIHFLYFLHAVNMIYC